MTLARSLSALLLSALFLSQAIGQTVVDSTFTGWQAYSNPQNWTPAEVPNNSAERTYNVAVPAGKVLSVDIDATINNLSLGRTLLTIGGHSLIVQGATTVTGPLPTEEGFYPGNSTLVRISAGKLDAGALSSFREGILSGLWQVDGGTFGPAPATLQFHGANVVTLRKAQLRLAGVLSRIIDENGNDGLRNLAHVESTSEFDIFDRDFTTSAAFTNDGHLSIGSGVFHIQGALTNFDSTTRTLTSGSYRVSQSYGPPDTPAKPGVLRFPGADIVNNAASIELSGPLSSITDLNGADALRNFGRNSSSGVFRLSERDFTTSGDFTNDGLLDGTGTFTVSGALTNFDPAARRLSGGKFHSKLRFNGADIVRNAASIYVGTITDENGQDALRNLKLNEPGGTLRIAETQLRPAGEFANAGSVLTAAYLDNTGIVMPPGKAYLQTAGETVLAPGTITGPVQIQGGMLAGYWFFHTGGSQIKGDLLIGDGGSLLLGDLHVEGSVQFTEGAKFRIAANASGGLQVTGAVQFAGTLQIEFDDRIPPDSSTLRPIVQAGSFTGAFSNAPHGTRLPTSSGRGSFVVLYGVGGAVSLGGYERIPPSAQLLNISTRASVGTGNDAAIGGFIVGTNNKRVVVRALGPSLQAEGVSGPLQNPTLTLHNSSGAVIASNDDWAATQRDEIVAAGLAPADERESAIVATLGRGAYTAVMRGQNDTTGIGLVEVYDVSHESGGKIGNLSTRGRVDADNPLIGGFIAGGGGEGNAEVFVRGIGSALRSRGVQNFLPDPTVELRGANGDLVAFNDDHDRLAEGAERPPFYLGGADPQDAQIFATVPPGNYTAVVRGKDGASGVALVEAYDINR